MAPPLAPQPETPSQTQNPTRKTTRPRVREVSSRFMSPSPSPSLPSTPQVNHNSHTHNTKHHLEHSRTLPSHLLSRSTTSTSSTPRQQQQRFSDENINILNRSNKPKSAIKLFNDNSKNHDTPVPVTMGPTTSKISRHKTWDSAASKLLRSTVSSNLSEESERESNADCESVKSEPCNDNGSGAGVGRIGEGGVRMGKVARSLNLPPMPGRKEGGGGEGKKGGGAGGGVGVGGGMGVGLKRGGSLQQEEYHRMRVLQNCYLQWRFVNAKAEAVMVAKKRESERQLYSLGLKISELQESVMNKRAELRSLQRTKILSEILEAQMPALDEWSSLEEDYSCSLQSVTKGLSNVSSQLPLVGNIRGDAKEIEEALICATKSIEMIFSQVQNFIPQAAKMDCFVSDLARVHSGEISLVEECGDLLSKTHLSQVEECSLRGQIMQFHQVHHDGLKDEKPPVGVANC